MIIIGFDSQAGASGQDCNMNLVAFEIERENGILKLGRGCVLRAGSRIDTR